MITMDFIGSYLGRSVKASVLTTNSPEKFCYDVSYSMVLIYTCTYFETKGIEFLLEKLIKLEPMAIVFAGVNAEEMFDHALRFLSCYPSKNHIMTKLCNQNEFSEVVEDFLSATWPAEER